MVIELRQVTNVGSNKYLMMQTHEVSSYRCMASPSDVYREYKSRKSMWIFICPKGVVE